jgi:hypothetical protein
MSCERLAMGPLLQRDIENLVAVLLRGLQRQAERTKGQVDESAPAADSPTSTPDAQVAVTPHARVGGAQRKPSLRRATAPRKRR